MKWACSSRGHAFSSCQGGDVGNCLFRLHRSEEVEVSSLMAQAWGVLVRLVEKRANYYPWGKAFLDRTNCETRNNTVGMAMVRGELFKDFFDCDARCRELRKVPQLP